MLRAFTYRFPHLTLVAPCEAGFLVIEKLMPKVGRCPAGGPQTQRPVEAGPVSMASTQEFSDFSGHQNPWWRVKNHRFLSPTPERLIPWVCLGAQESAFLTNTPGGPGGGGSWNTLKNN